MLQNYGHIPNGGRVYYLGRSHPPLISHMVKSYLEFTGDQAFAISALPELEIEFEFFERLHTVWVEGHSLYRYIDDSSGPRPESYKEDYYTADHYNTAAEKEEFYSEIKAGAESGMDFTSRWFITANGTNNGELHDIKTRSIVPVELNAIIYENARIIAELFKLENNLIKYEAYQARAEQIRAGIEAVLWDDKVGAWLDYDLENKKRRNYFCGTNLSPLWVRAFDPDKEAHITRKVLKYIDDVGIDSYPGGVPNTLQVSRKNVEQKFKILNTNCTLKH